MVQFLRATAATAFSAS